MITTIFTCSNCGAQYPKWQGRCTECGKWSTIIEEKNIEKKEKSPAVSPLQAIDLSRLDKKNEKRLTTNIDELDRVLGGGIVVGSFLLLGGDPGIGKSTLALQLSGQLKKCLYASGEESAEQVKMRAVRLTSDLSRLLFLPETNVEKIIATAEAEKPDLLIIDSIQTIYSADSPGSAGSVSQITASAAKLMALAKTKNIAVLAIGHVTKDGLVAGPKTLEHLVDTVIYLENDAQNFYKILRTVKNRFGSTGEIGIFEMTASGLKEISDPTGIFYDQNLSLTNPGISATMILEGSRPFLIEVQALASKTSFGYPQRRSAGFDLNRLQMLLAVLAKHSKINTGNHDIYLNIAGGLKIKETSADLAVCLAVASAYAEKTLPEKTLLLGEVGLSGEIRSVPQLERRLKEAKRLGFVSAVIPATNKINITGLKILAVKNIGEAISALK